MEYKEQFLKCFNGFGGKYRRDQVFSDFIIMASASLHNAVAYNDELEDEYMQVVKKYGRDELQRFSEMLSIVVMGLDCWICDFLGDLYMSLELGNSRAGQFFTPWHVSKLMAQITHGDGLANMDKEFITLSDPACGAGCMPIAFAEVMREAGHNPQKKLWVQCWEVDSTTARMCYIQLALLHIPAEIVIGNSLTLEVRQVMRTPAHYLGFWSSKLAGYDNEQEAIELCTSGALSESIDVEPITVVKKPNIIVEGQQFAMEF